MHCLKTYEEHRLRTQRMNLIDDPFFQKIAENTEACEELLRVLLDKPGLTIVENQTQRHLRNLHARSVILDVLCKDADGSLYNIEVQKDDKKSHTDIDKTYQKRVRFNLANLDTVFAEKGISFDQLPDIYSVFISELDPFQKGHTTYHIHRAITETADIVENGVHEIYVNAAADDGSDNAELMQYFLNSNGYHPKFKKISKQVMYFKESHKGVNEMANVFDEYAEERIMEKDKVTAMNMLEKNISVEDILDIIPSLTKETILQLQEQLKMQAVV